MDVIWRNGGAGDLFVGVLLTTPGADGGFSLKLLDMTTGAYNPIGTRVDPPPKPYSAVFKISAVEVAAGGNPMSLRLTTTLANPAGSDMPVLQDVWQTSPLNAEDANTGAPVASPAPLKPDAQQGLPQDYDFDVWFP